MKFNSMRSLQCPNAIAAFVPGKFAPKHGRVEALLAFRMNQAYNKPLTANIWGMSWKTFLGTRFCRMFAWSKKITIWRMESVAVPSPSAHCIRRTRQSLGTNQAIPDGKVNTIKTNNEGNIINR
jgi:hypothetical protein